MQMTAEDDFWVSLSGFS